jgi:hypothetical protein
VAPGRDSLVDVYHLHEHAKGREGVKRTKSGKSSENELERTLTLGHKRVVINRNYF